jgi:hypothetical protein
MHSRVGHLRAHRHRLGSGPDRSAAQERHRPVDVASFTIGRHSLFDVAAVLPDAATRSKQDGADAVIGNRLVSRFDLVLDYDPATLRLRPNDAFSEPF